LGGWGREFEFLMNLKYEFEPKEGILNGMTVCFIDLSLAPETLPFGKI
jgi:hypothetical protein